MDMDEAPILYSLDPNIGLYRGTGIFVGDLDDLSANWAAFRDPLSRNVWYWNQFTSSFFFEPPVWKKYQDPERGFWWYNRITKHYFFEAANTVWCKYYDSQHGPWWFNQDSNDFFFESTGANRP